MTNKINKCIVIPAIFLLLISFFSCMETTKDGVVHIIKEKKPKKNISITKKIENEANRPSAISWISEAPDKGNKIGQNYTQRKGKFLLNFDGIEIVKFIDTVMNQLFGYNFYINEDVKNIQSPVTIKMAKEISKNDLFNLFTEILKINGIQIDKSGDTYIFSGQKEKSFSIRGPIIYGREISDNLKYLGDIEVTFLLPLHNITPQILMNVIGPKVTETNLFFNTIEESNLLIINGMLSDIRYVLSLADLLDRVQFKNKSAIMISPLYWGIYELTEKIKELLSAEGINWKNAQINQSMNFIPLPKLNNIIVISPLKEWLKRVIYWVNTIDVPKAAGQARKVFNYKLRNVQVDSVIKVLKKYQESKNNLNQQGRPGNLSQKTSQVKSGLEPLGSVTLKDAEILPVEESNSIVIIATPVDYQKYLNILKKIDIPRNQVFVEVIIGEVTIDSETQFGMEFWANRYLYNTEFGTKGGLGIYKGTSQDGGISVPAGSNLMLRGILNGTQYEILLNALLSNNKINIISTPKLTVLENKDAEISIGSEVPIISSESAYGGYSNSQAPMGEQQSQNQSFYPFRSINYVPTGVILKVKASILSDNKVSLEIEQEISEAQENSFSSISSPEISKRSLKTTMVVREGEVALMGGLIQKKSTIGEIGIPVISKIPILGHLFKKSKKLIKKTELVVFINAKIIKKQNDMQEIVDGIKEVISNNNLFDVEENENR